MGSIQKNWGKIESIIDRALVKEPSERLEFIRKECAGDQQLLEQVQELLAAIKDSEGFLEDSNMGRRLLSDWKNERSARHSSFIGRQIGSYKIIELIDHGGMGSVFLAKRVEADFEHRVALKVVRRGMDTPANIARFKREQQILANLHHPNIAQLYDGGFTEEGLPYLVMEYIQGTPIDLFCNQQGYSIDERLELFQKVCRAIRYAHKNLVIHRDLKPSNIFVTREGHVKILDFGISKMLEEDSDSQFKTSDRLRPASLRYAAPEQLVGKPITTAVDTFGLGVLLYRLLIEVHPFDFKGKTLTQIEQTVCKKPIPNPVYRYQQLSSKKQKRIAANRSATPGSLLNSIKGDVSCIVLKALSQNPDIRYHSAGELFDDLVRYQQKLPIEAKKPHITYTLGKFIQRHRKGFITAAVFLLALLGFAGFYMKKITQERNQAELEAQKAQQISDFVVDIFEVNDPAYSQGDTITADRLLNEARNKLDQLDNQPLSQSNMMLHIGKAHYKLGQYDQAAELLDEAFAIQKENQDNPTVGKADMLRYRGLVDLKNFDYERAEDKLIRSLEIYENLRNNDMNSFKGLTSLANVVHEKGDPDSAKVLYQQAMDLHAELANAEPKELSQGYVDLAELYTETGEKDRAERMMETALEQRKEHLGLNHPQTLHAMTTLARFYREEELIEQAVDLLDQATQISKKIYGSKSIKTADIYENLALTYKQGSQYRKAEDLYSKASQIKEDLVGKNHPYLAVIENNLGVMSSSKKEYDQALKHHRQSLELRRETLGEAHPKVGLAYKNIGFAFKKSDQLDSAQTYFRKAVDNLGEFHQKPHPNVAENLYQLGVVYGRQERWEQCEEYLKKALAIQKEVLSETEPDMVKTNYTLGLLMERTERYAQAIPYYEKVLKIRKDIPANDYTNFDQTAKQLAGVLEKTGRQSRADSLLTLIK